MRTDLHALHIEAWLRDQHGVDNFDIAVVDPHPLGSAMFLERCSAALVDGVGLRPGAAAYLCVGAPSAWALRQLRRIGFAGQVVRVDEGIGSYGDIVASVLALRREGANVRRIAGRVGSSVLLRAWGQRWPSFRDLGNEWVVNDAVAREFDRRRPATHPEPEHVVYLLQPWASLGVQSRSGQLAVIDRVRRAVESSGRRLLVRPHPSETTFDGDVADVLDPVGLAEADPHVLSAGLVIGETTTSLLNLSAFFGRPAIRLESASTPRISARQRSLFDWFVPTTLHVDRPIAPSAFTDRR